MSVVDNPIINGPYDLPSRHWRTDDAGGITDELVDERRRSESWRPVPRPRKQRASGQIDTDYDGESFFVRHAYFAGGNDPYARLKRALKADIDEAAWATLYGTRSRPFPPPSTGRIAVKAINDYGDEVLSVIEVDFR